MSQAKRVRVVINDSRFIPNIGKGPITKPINILESQYKILKQVGFNIEKVIPNIGKIKPVESSKVIDKETEIPIEEGTNESENEIINDKAYTKEELISFTKNNLKKILDKRNIPYKYSDTISILRDAIIESNPKDDEPDDSESETIPIDDTSNTDSEEE